jgi:hypothetical protein
LSFPDFTISFLVQSTTTQSSKEKISLFKTTFINLTLYDAIHYELPKSETVMRAFFGSAPEATDTVDRATYSTKSNTCA